MTLFIFILPLFWFLAQANYGDYYTLKVEPLAENCFYEEVKEDGTNIHFDYHVYEGGLLDIDVKVFEQTKQIFSKLYFEGKETSTYSFVANTGTYGFCFNNEMSRFTVKTVSFSIQLVSPNSDKGEKSPIESTISKIEMDLDKIERQQQQYRIREHMHRNTAEETNTRVYMWSLIESAILLLMCFGQIFYVRRLFSR